VLLPGDGGCGGDARVVVEGGEGAGHTSEVLQAFISFENKSGVSWH
jgi:hypothetical protein